MFHLLLVDIKENDVVKVISYLGAGDADTKVIPFHSVTNATNTHEASTAFTEADGIVVPAANYLGADPLSATATRLSFKSLTGTAVDDDILLTHSTGKFKDVCKMMEAAINADHTHAPIVITDVANSINVTFQQIQKYEKATNYPKEFRTRKMVEYLGRDYETFLKENNVHTN